MNDTDINRSMEIIEDALRTLPLEPVPGLLRSRVMYRVRSLSAAPKFVFPWLEAAISLMLSTLVTSVSYLLLSLSPVAVMRLVQSVRLFLILPANRPVIFAGLSGLAILVLCLFSAVRIFLPVHRAPARMLRIR
jgi:hypothetical protein